MNPPPAAAPKRFPCTWEQAIERLRADPQHRAMIEASYLTADVVENARRFGAGEEFDATLALIARHVPGAAKVLDVPGGNGIATYAFASRGFEVSTVEPDGSASVGRGAIRRVLDHYGLQADIVAAYGEALPFPAGYFDVVYVRQGLHHAKDLRRMVAEYARVLRPGGLLLGCREHVVDNYGESLQRFLDSQVDHQLYGGENAFTLADYRAAIESAGLALVEVIEPYDSPINLHPNSVPELGRKVLETTAGRLLRKVLPDRTVVAIGLWQLKRSRRPGRLHTFVARKSPC